MFGSAAGATQHFTQTAPSKCDEFTVASASTDEPASADDISTGAESTDTFAEPSADLVVAAEEPPWESEDQMVDDAVPCEDVDMAGAEGNETGRMEEKDETGEQRDDEAATDESEGRPGDDAPGKSPTPSCDTRGIDEGPRRPPPPSHSADAQQLRRARKRYREDAEGNWIKGKEAQDGSWTPEVGAQALGSLEAAANHERQKLQLRRCSWSNLRSATKSAVATEGVETRLLAASESASTRQHITSTSNALGTKLGAKIEEGVERMLNSAKQSRGTTTNPGQLAFFSRLMAGFKAVELKELLVAHGVEPVGTKQTFAQLIVETV